jgi:hypothetical protein
MLGLNVGQRFGGFCRRRVQQRSRFIRDPVEVARGALDLGLVDLTCEVRAWMSGRLRIAIETSSVGILVVFLDQVVRER